MVELLARSPCEGMLPLTIGSVAAVEEMPGAMSIVAPFAGQEKAVSEAMKAAYGLGFPAVGRVTGRQGGTRALWFGQGQALLMGAASDVTLAGKAAITDQSDAWAVVRLSGADAGAVLARLTPLDLRDAAFRSGDTARTELAHMMGSVTRLGADAFLLMVFRSMAATLVHDLQVAIEQVAGRARLG